jgi:hypothetical protein
MSQYVTYDNFYPEVLPYFPGMPELLVGNAIRNACIEFAERSNFLFYTPTPLLLLANEDEYDLTLDLPTDTIVSKVQSAWANEEPLTPKAEEDLLRIYGLDWRKQVGQPTYYTQYEFQTLILVPAPTVTVVGGLECTLVIRPSVQSTTVDGSLLHHWHEVIAAGARSRLYATPGQAYENPRMAGAYAALFESGVMDAQIRRRAGLTRAVLRVRPPRFV